MAVTNESGEMNSAWNKYSAGLVRIWEGVRRDMGELGALSLNAAEALISLYQQDIWEFITSEREGFRYSHDSSVDVILYLSQDEENITGRISKSGLCRDNELAVLQLEINRRRLWNVTKPCWAWECIHRSELIEMASDRAMEFGYAPSVEEHIENQIRDTLSTMSEKMTSDYTAKQLYISLLNGHIPLSALDGVPKRNVISAEYSRLLEEDGWADVDSFLQLVGEDIFNKHFHDALVEHNHSREDLFARMNYVMKYLDPEETSICTRAIRHINLLDEKLLTS